MSTQSQMMTFVLLTTLTMVGCQQSVHLKSESESPDKTVTAEVASRKAEMAATTLRKIELAFDRPEHLGKVTFQPRPMSGVIAACEFFVDDRLVKCLAFFDGDFQFEAVDFVKEDGTYFAGTELNQAVFEE